MIDGYVKIVFGMNQYHVNFIHYTKRSTNPENDDIIIYSKPPPDQILNQNPVQPKYFTYTFKFLEKDPRLWPTDHPCRREESYKLSLLSETQILEVLFRNTKVGTNYETSPKDEVFRYNL